MELPSDFLKNMMVLLGPEFEPFLESYNRPEQIGLRLNPLKTDVEAILDRLPWRLEKLPWTDDGFQIKEGSVLDTPAPGKHPYHVAGVYYLQEPAAMAAAAALALTAPIQAGERILDLCAAPGGKSTHLAGLMGGSGLLVANETHPRRVWELAENLERWGARNAIILNETPARLAEKIPAFFDRVLVDAPCTGEGMFRKSESARRDWSPEAVRACAFRQSAILDDALRLLRPDGLLIYSTCTFNPEENEVVLAELLDRSPGCTLVSLEKLQGSARGRPEWAGEKPALSAARRLWPHLAPGEGHFIAALRKGDAHASKSRPAPLGRKSAQPGSDLFRLFEEDHLSGKPVSTSALEIKSVGSRLYAFRPESPDLSGLKVIHPGWWLGDMLGGERGRKRFEPAHALAMGLRRDQARQFVSFNPADPNFAAYLRGETLPSSGDDGWILVCVDEFPLGWGKRIGGIIKNAYPKGLRIR